MLLATSPSTTAPNVPRGFSAQLRRSVLDPPRRGAGLERAQRGDPRRHGPAPLRSPPSPPPAHSVDLLHRGPFHVPEGRLRRRRHDAVHRRAPRRSGARPPGPRRLPVRRQGGRGRGLGRHRRRRTPADRGLTDAEIADVVFAASARCFFTGVLDGLGAQLDVQTAETFPEALLSSMVVGRPVAEP